MTESRILSQFKEEGQRANAFTALVDLYQDRIYRHMYGMSGNRQDAEDLTQNVFIKVWKNLAGFRAESGLYTWIYRIATNEALGLLKKRKKQFTTSLDDDSTALEGRLSADSDVDGDAINTLLQKAIAQLPVRQKQVFLLRYNEEMPYNRMSEVLGISEGGLKANYHHAVKKIESLLKGN